jgi:hypothetical protein
VDALAYVFIHNTNALHHFIQIYIYSVMKDPFVLFIFLPTVFSASPRTGVYFPTKGG